MPDSSAKTSALERTRRVRSALVEAVRMSRLSSRRRRAFDTGALSRRRGARLVAILYAITFVCVFVIPSVGSIVYFGFVASPQFVTESKFVVQGGSNLRADGIEAVTGLPATNVVQDTQVVVNYIQSAAIVEQLQHRLDIRQLYGNSNIDWVSRFDVTKPFEKLVDYWKSKVEVSIQLPGGLVTVSIRAFSAEDTLRISQAVLEFSEKLVNDLNQRMRKDNVGSSKQEFERAAERLGAVRGALETARNAEGLLDAGHAGRALGELVTGLRADRLKLQQDYESQSAIVLPDAPQMRALKTRIDTISEQIRSLEAKMTSVNATTSTDKLISEVMTKFSELELERRIAERQYSSAAAAFQLAQVSAERRLVYLQTFVLPALPEDPRYPKRALSIIIVCLGSLTIFGIVNAVLTLARNHMA